MINKQKNNKKSKETAKVILQSIGLAALVTSVMVFPGLAHVVKWVEESARESRLRAKRVLNDLQKRKVIKLVKDGSGWKLYLTKKGKNQLKKYQLKDLKVIRPVRWDGMWRMVMFDIPESSKYLRDFIRRKLNTLGFIAIQKSIYMHPFPCKEIVEFFRDYYRLKAGELYIFEARVIEGEKILKKYFKLK
ncbi:MAG: hypothetical protein COT91_00675 [Candidatus Doudnabacteria bacterium CG10_big_fil_rev_8_21_14_0_10_41_10]|uniref:Transcriptional repressor PaaX-like central Cas2-like domain-containing protein n=1 Tax=Candidatus Doudnabacteria bacterium CG10_big_fil_rev_8_21_14_0_10_41_10 TaxID=1974551 RepID=A0A2H0VEQ6_9BACT|nr:MAG: hypothetical protein COT91_00675 [Candidatus Doudnabacteria bacterium CG10_big_fil_rev_8_21_14_0_10_41_10]